MSSEFKEPKAIPVEGSQVNGPSGSEGEASCNTPPSSHLKGYSTCIDYLKFTFPKGYERDRADFDDLLKLLRVDMSMTEDLRSMHGFTDVLRIAPGTNLLYGGTMTNRRTGESTTMLEMSGEGCRDYEDRYFSPLFMADQSLDRSEVIRKAWIELIELCLKMNGECKRVDLPTDDFSGNITVDEIKKKVAHREYGTKLRALEVTDQKKEELEDVKTIKDSKLSGYSATFGTRKSLQLCIYDKLAERMSKGIDPRVETWIRYEVRFYHERAEQEIHRLLDALKANKFNPHIVGCLSSIIEFKEPSLMSDHHRADAKPWQKWTEFTKHGAESGGFSISPRLMSVESNASWLMREGSKSFLRVLASLDGNGIATIGSALGFKAIQKLTKADLQYINQYRKSIGAKEFLTLGDLKNYFLGLPDLVVEFDEHVTDLLFEKGTKKELQKRREERAKKPETNGDVS